MGGVPSPSPGGDGGVVGNVCEPRSCNVCDKCCQGFLAHVCGFFFFCLFVCLFVLFFVVFLILIFFNLFKKRREENDMSWNKLNERKKERNQ